MPCAAARGWGFGGSAPRQPADPALPAGPWCALVQRLAEMRAMNSERTRKERERKERRRVEREMAKLNEQ